MIKSDDGGKTWSEPLVVAYDGEDKRCYDPCLWTDPCGRLWFIWNTSPEQAVYCAICDNPDSDPLSWSAPRAIAEEVMLNKPTVLSGGEWLFPVAVWNSGICAAGFSRSKAEPKGSFVWRSTDAGATFERLGMADVPDREFDEHMVLEKRDGSLLMLVRTSYGIGESRSYDGGRTWTPGKDSGLDGPGARFFIRRLRSGNVLLINHYRFHGRNNLTAMLSTDDGETYAHFLLLDGRDNVSYPDAVQGDDGYIYAVYDRDRRGDGEILLAKFTEDDVLCGKIRSPGGFLAQSVCRLR